MFLAEEEKATKLLVRTLEKVTWKLNKYIADNFNLEGILPYISRKSGLFHHTNMQ